MTSTNRTRIARFFICVAMTAALISCGKPKSDSDNLSSSAQTSVSTKVYTDDIPRFWAAYDAINATSDPREKRRLLSSLYLDPGSPGLHAMMRARNYQSGEFLEAIENYPEFWTAIRPHTLKAVDFSESIEAALRDMRNVYPEGDDVPVYFVIGALRTGGTANDGKLLIGAELAMATPEIPSHELSSRLSHLSRYFGTNPKASLVTLNLHEYVHTQQQSISGTDLLSQSLFEGVAEYISTKAVGRVSATEAVAYGATHHDAVIAAFEKEILSEDFSNWIWNSADNQFGTRDMGYYVGYVIAQKYIENSLDRKLAIKTLIELDYSSKMQVRDVVDASEVFTKAVSEYEAR